MKAIITGATGMIGLSLVNKLLEENVEMLLIIRDTKRVNRIPKSKLIKIKYCDLKDYNTIVNDENETYDVLYHFAWQGTTGEDRENMYMQNENIKYALDTVVLAKKFNCKIFIGAGSQAEYGKVECDLGSMTSTNPITGYGIAKLCAGQMTRKLCNQLGMKHIWTRILSVYGPYDNEKSLVMQTIKAISQNHDLRLTKCDQIWDYIYSKDVANIFYLLYKNGLNGKIYVIGNGEKRKLKEYVEMIKDTINNNYKIVYGTIPYYDNQVMYLCADTSDLVNDLNYVQNYKFNEGVNELYEWFIKNK